MTETDPDTAPAEPATPDTATEPDPDWQAAAQRLRAELDFTRAQLEHAQAILGAATGVLVGLADGSVRLYRDAVDFYRDRWGTCHVTDREHTIALYAEGAWRFAEFTSVAAAAADEEG